MKNLFLIIVIVLGALIEAFFITSVGLDKIKDYIIPLVSINGAIFALAALLQPFFLLLCMICYLPMAFKGFSFEIGIITLNGVSGSAIILTGVCAMRKIFTGRPLNLNTTDLFLAGICGTFMISTAIAPSIIDAGYLAFNAIFIPVLVYFTTRILVETEGQYNFLVRSQTLAYALLGAFIISAYATTGLRAMPFGLMPIDTSTVMIFPLFYLMASKTFPRYIRLPALLFCLVAIGLTFSRVIFVIIILSPLLYQWFRKGKGAMLFMLFFAFTLGFTFFIVDGMEMFRPNQVFQGEEVVQSSERITNIEHWKHSIYGRAGQFKQGLEEFYRKPFFGMGLTKGKVTFTQHNFVVEWLQYGGVSGYCFYMLFFLSHVWRMSPYARYDLPIRVNLLILFGVLSNAFFNGILHGIMPYAAFMAMALSEARAKFVPAPEEHMAMEAEAAKAS